MTSTWEGRDAAGLARLLGLPALEVHDAVPSTSDRVRELVEAGAPSWTAVLADAQTAGRGRRGRGWHSPPGLGVWVSLALPGGALEVDALLPLRTVSALARRLAAAGGPEAGVKWPNDLLLADGRAAGRAAGRKVAGILTERVVLPGGDARVVVGVGINVLGVGPEAGAGAGALVDAWADAHRLPVLEAVVEAARDARSLPGDTLGPGELEAWSRRDVLQGREATVLEGPRSVHTGRVRGVDPRGHLLLETAGGLRHLASGTVRVGSSGRP